MSQVAKIKTSDAKSINEATSEELEEYPKYNSAAGIIAIGEQFNFGATKIYQELSKFESLSLNMSAAENMKFFCEEESFEHDGVSLIIQPLRYAALKDWRIIVDFLVEMISKRCFHTLYEAAKYFDSLQILHAMVESRKKLSATLLKGRLLEPVIVPDGEYLLFCPWSKDPEREAKTVLECLKDNMVMATGSKQKLIGEMEQKMEDLKNRHVRCMCQFFKSQSNCSIQIHPTEPAYHQQTFASEGYNRASPLEDNQNHSPEPYHKHLEVMNKWKIPCICKQGKLRGVKRTHNLLGQEGSYHIFGKDQPSRSSMFPTSQMGNTTFKPRLPQSFTSVPHRNHPVLLQLQHPQTLYQTQYQSAGQVEGDQNTMTSCKPFLSETVHQDSTKCETTTKEGDENAKQEGVNGVKSLPAFTDSFFKRAKYV